MTRNSSKNSAANLAFDDEGTGANVRVLTDAPSRTRRAREYEEKVSGVLNMAMRMCAGNEATVSDAAAILAHGPTVASKAGDLADQDEKVRRAIDLITSGTDNPYAALALATLPLVAQILRNHETTPEIHGGKLVGIRIPFTKKRVEWKLRFRLRNPVLRSVTQPPDMLTAATFANPAIREALAAQGVDVAWRDPREKNGTNK